MSRQSWQKDDDRTGVVLSFSSVVGGIVEPVKDNLAAV